VDEGALDRAVSALRRGGVVAAATESFFGLLADPFSAPALNRVFALKGRQAARVSALIAPDLSTWARLVSQRPALAQTLAERFWPGPLTLVLPAAADLPEAVVMDGRVGVRIAGPSPAASLCARFNGALTATSANLAGEPPCTEPEQIRQLFPDAIDAGELLVLDASAPGGAVSTLVAVSAGGFQILRPGAISQQQLEQSVRQQI
jgi:L-threonylcarbamoyladenylate synthase